MSSQNHLSWRRFDRKGQLGSGFERLVAAIYHKDGGGGRLQRNEKINGREFDITIRGRTGDGTESLTVIECRDWKKKLQPTDVDAFANKARDVGATRKAMVTRKAFTRGARQVAKRHGIELWTIEEITHELPRHVVNVRHVHDYRVLETDADASTVHSYIPVGFDTTLTPGEMYRNTLGVRHMCLSVSVDKVRMLWLEPEVRLSAVVELDPTLSEQYVPIDDPNERRYLREFAEANSKPEIEQYLTRDPLP